MDIHSHFGNYGNWVWVCKDFVTSQRIVSRGCDSTLLSKGRPKLILVTDIMDFFHEIARKLMDQDPINDRLVYSALKKYMIIPGSLCICIRDAWQARTMSMG